MPLLSSQSHPDYHHTPPRVGVTAVSSTSPTTSTPANNTGSPSSYTSLSPEPAAVSPPASSATKTTRAPSQLSPEASRTMSQISEGLHVREASRMCASTWRSTRAGDVMHAGDKGRRHAEGKGAGPGTELWAPCETPQVPGSRDGAACTGCVRLGSGCDSFAGSECRGSAGGVGAASRRNLTLSTLHTPCSAAVPAAPPDPPATARIPAGPATPSVP
eukprot:scaffold7474_cov113-Isochrysis_galbana.AAC.2